MFGLRKWRKLYGDAEEDKCMAQMLQEVATGMVDVPPFHSHRCGGCRATLGQLVWAAGVFTL